MIDSCPEFTLLILHQHSNSSLRETVFYDFIRTICHDAICTIIFCSHPYRLLVGRCKTDDIFYIKMIAAPLHVMFTEFMGISKKKTHIMLVISHCYHMRLWVVEQALNMIVDQTVDQRKRLEYMAFQITLAIIDKDSCIGSGYVKLVIRQAQYGSHIRHNFLTQFPSLGMRKISIEMGIGIHPEVALTVHLA